jgi:hypothetical protein
MADKVYAFMRGAAIYTLKPNPLRRREDPQRAYRFLGFCDGQPIGFFRTKAEFEAFVDLEPAPVPLGPYGEATLRAIAWSTYEGTRMLTQVKRTSGEN